MTALLRIVNLGFSVPERGTEGYAGQRQGRHELNLPETGLPAGCMIQEPMASLQDPHPTLLCHRPQPTFSEDFFIIVPGWVLNAVHTY